jgi:hypothetical protein
MKTIQITEAQFARVQERFLAEEKLLKKFQSQLAEAKEMLHEGSVNKAFLAEALVKQFESLLAQNPSNGTVVRAYETALNEGFSKSAIAAMFPSLLKKGLLTAGMIAALTAAGQAQDTPSKAAPKAQHGTVVDWNSAQIKNLQTAERKVRNNIPLDDVDRKVLADPNAPQKVHFTPGQDTPQAPGIDDSQSQVAKMKNLRYQGITQDVSIGKPKGADAVAFISKMLTSMRNQGAPNTMLMQTLKNNVKNGYDVVDMETVANQLGMNPSLVSK